MEVTWKIRPDAYWHDGTPLTAEDFGFGFEVIRDPRLGVATLGEVVNMTGVRVVDPKTFVVSWKTISVQREHEFLRWGPGDSEASARRAVAVGGHPGLRSKPGLAR